MSNNLLLEKPGEELMRIENVKEFYTNFANGVLLQKMVNDTDEITLLVV